MLEIFIISTLTLKCLAKFFFIFINRYICTIIKQGLNKLIRSDINLSNVKDMNNIIMQNIYISINAVILNFLFIKENALPSQEYIKILKIIFHNITAFTVFLIK